MSPTRRDILKLSAGAALALPLAAGATIAPIPAQASGPIDIETDIFDETFPPGSIIARPAKIGGCIYLHVDDREASGSQPISTVVGITGTLNADGTWTITMTEAHHASVSGQAPQSSEVSHATWPEIIDAAFSLPGVVHDEYTAEEIREARARAAARERARESR